METNFELVEIDGRGREFLSLTVAAHQQDLVATMAESYSDALFPPDDGWGTDKPWMRGVLRDGIPAAFIMCANPTTSEQEPWIWRLLVDQKHQGVGAGTFAVKAALDHYKQMGFARVLVCWVPSEGSPAPFYKRLGFEETGEVLDGETVAALKF